MINKEKYREFCKKESGIPIFSKDWWLDSVCPDNKYWDVILIEKGGQIVASMPYIIGKKRSFKTIEMPQLTQKLGPYIKYPDNQKYDAKLSYEKEIMTELINQLPDVAYFKQNFNYSITNWLPFYWKGFSQTTYYTYVIENTKDLQIIETNFSHAKRKNLNKCRNLLKIVFDIDAKSFYENHKMTLQKQGQKISYSFDLFNKIYNSAYNNNSAKTIAAFDKNGNLNSALFIIWDKVSVYNLISTIDPDYRNNGSATLLVLEAIKIANKKGLKFDFEGSMLEGVENSFRQFGTVQKPYFQISKTNSKLYKLLSLGKEAINILMSK